MNKLGAISWRRYPYRCDRRAGTANPAIKDWMLREGCRNGVMDAYLAYTCATTGDLRTALAGAHVDDALLVSAGATIDQVIALALRELPLDTLATGPAADRGLGPAFADHQVFTAIVPRLRAYPNSGWPLVAAALRSPVIRHRNQALRTLAAWGRECWTPEIQAALEVVWAQLWATRKATASARRSPVGVKPAQ